MTGIPLKKRIYNKISLHSKLSDEEAIIYVNG
jgi:hypothetical protein